MSENKNYEQVGKLAEEYSRLKGEREEAQKKIMLANGAFSVAAQALQQNALTVRGEQIVVGPSAYRPGLNAQDLNNLLNKHELFEVLSKRKHLDAELERVKAELHIHAPHLLQ